MRQTEAQKRAQIRYRERHHDLCLVRNRAYSRRYRMLHPEWYQAHARLKTMLPAGAAWDNRLEPWTIEEDAILRDWNWRRHCPILELARSFGRTYAAVQQRTSKLRRCLGPLSARHGYWNAAELELLLDWMSRAKESRLMARELGQQMERSAEAVFAKASAIRTGRYKGSLLANLLRGANGDEAT